MAVRLEAATMTDIRTLKEVSSYSRMRLMVGSHEDISGCFGLASRQHANSLPKAKPNTRKEDEIFRRK